MNDAIKRAVTPGVSERAPVPGFIYHGFIVHPRKPGLVTLAIAHREGRNAVLDLCRDGLTIAEASAHLKRYGIRGITGTQDDNPDVNLALAACGALTEAMRP